MPRSTAGATLPWLSLLCLKRERNLRSSARALDKFLCLEVSIYDYGYVEKTQLETFIWIADLDFSEADNEISCILVRSMIRGDIVICLLELISSL